MAHLNDGSGIQQHSAGPDYPGVIYGTEFEGDTHLYWGVLFGGFDYGVFPTHDDAQACIRHIKSVRALDGEQRAQAERVLALFLDAKRAARAGLRPDGIHALSTARSIALSGPGRDAMPVDTMSAPIIARMRWGYTEQCDAFLTAWGFNPADFQAHGTLAPADDGTRKLEAREVLVYGENLDV